ncbi:MAG: hypothetical protein U1C55_06930 [Smithellaceae bacterium]|nr:hypothetical protein [Smithellaceae bacterium]
MNEYIDRRFKRTFILRFCIGMVIISIFSGILFFLIIPKEAANLYVSLIYSFHQTAANLVPLILIVGFFEIILASLFTLLFALFLSHKVGGPIYKLQSNLERLRRGDFNLPGISFREADQGQILAVKFNEMMRSWHSNFKELKYNCSKLSLRMSSLETKWPRTEEGSLESSRTITRIRHDLEKMRDVLDRFVI